jgi:hypothetical protein
MGELRRGPLLHIVHNGSAVFLTSNIGFIHAWCFGCSLRLAWDIPSQGMTVRIAFQVCAGLLSLELFSHKRSGLIKAWVLLAFNTAETSGGVSARPLCMALQLEAMDMTFGLVDVGYDTLAGARFKAACRAAYSPVWWPLLSQA